MIHVLDLADLERIACPLYRQVMRHERERLQNLFSPFANYDPAQHGYAALLEATDPPDQVPLQRGSPVLTDLLQSPWEFVEYHPDPAHFRVELMLGQDLGVVLVIPDAPWLDLRLWGLLTSRCTT